MAHAILAFMSAAAVLSIRSAAAEDWPAFRGPRGDGTSTETDVPTEWSAEKNVRWRVPLESKGNGSPIVVQGHVFLHVAADKGRKRGLVCFDSTNGRERWSRHVEYDKVDRTHGTNPHDASTPVSDGERVVVWHGSAGLFCYDLDGRELWSRDLGAIDHFLGFGSSPVIHDGRILLNFGPGANQVMTALDLSTGRTLWTTPEPGGNGGQRPKEVASYATPIVVEHGGRTRIVCNMPTRVVAYEPVNGAIDWTIDGMIGRQHLVYTSPLIAGDRGIAMAGFNGPRFGYRLGGEGDATDTHRTWHATDRNPQRIGTGVVVDGHVYTANVGPGTIECLDLATGELAWRERTPSGDTWASIVHADGYLFVTTQRGTTHIVRPSPDELEIVASNTIGEKTNATPALSDGEWFIRTFEHLYCIGRSSTD